MQSENQGDEIGNFTPHEYLRMAIYFEEEGARFYRELAGRTTDKRIKNELDFLWKEEEAHSAHFGKLLEAIGRSPSEALDDRRLTSLADRGVFGPIKRLRAEDILCDNAEALKLGAVIKRRMISFFHDLLDRTEDEKAKEVLKEIIEQEEHHLEKLMLLMAY
jgi:rubrerythrin